MTSVIVAAVLALAAIPVLSIAKELPPPEPIGKAANTAYRQVMPDGRIVYSDKPVKGAKIDEAITIDPPIKGNTWSAAPGKPPKVAPRNKPTPVNRVASIPVPGKDKTLDEANSEVIHAEMRVEDARKRREGGVEPLPGERTGTATGASRLNEAYKARQRALAQAVAEAEAALKKSIAERDALRPLKPR